MCPQLLTSSRKPGRIYRQRTYEMGFECWDEWQRMGTDVDEQLGRVCLSRDEGGRREGRGCQSWLHHVQKALCQCVSDAPILHGACTWAGCLSSFLPPDGSIASQAGDTPPASSGNDSAPMSPGDDRPASLRLPPQVLQTVVPTGHYGNMVRNSRSVLVRCSLRSQ